MSKVKACNEISEEVYQRIHPKNARLWLCGFPKTLTDFVHLSKSEQLYTQQVAFCFDNTIYRQIDSLSMGSSLSTVLAKIIMTELEKSLIVDMMIILF